MRMVISTKIRNYSTIFKMNILKDINNEALFTQSPLHECWNKNKISSSKDSFITSAFKRYKNDRSAMLNSWKLSIKKE